METKVYKIINKRIETSGKFFIETDEDNLLNHEPFFGSWTDNESEYKKDAEIQLFVKWQPYFDKREFLEDLF